MSWDLNVTYPGGLYAEVDSAIESIAGFRDSSGFDFGSEERDMQFSYATELEAARIKKRLLTEVPTHPIAISVDGPYNNGAG